MTGSLKDFGLMYGKMKGIPEDEMLIFVGALTKDTIEKLDTYKQFVLALNEIAPQLLQLNSVLGNKDG